MFRRSLVVPIVALLSLAAAACTDLDEETVLTPATAHPAPVPVTELVAILEKAAREKNFRVLSEHMVEEFRYSFGRAPSRKEALSRYRTNPDLLNTMASILGRKCASKTTGSTTYYVCPAAATDEKIAYYGWRAGFRQKEDKSWEFIWFIAGD